MKKLILLASLVFAATGMAIAEGAVMGDQDYPLGTLYGDAMPGAPELAARGSRQVGVRTVALVHAGQVDVLRGLKEGGSPKYDRQLKAELWYPALLAAGQKEICTYSDFMGRADQPGTLIPFSFVGRAARDASPDRKAGPFPLVVLSHGYPGSRYLLSYLCENLASKGYVVAAIAHADSTYEDTASFASTLVNRPLDQRFVLDEMLSPSDKGAFWAGLCDPARVGLVGYSMGGYGALRTLGAGCNERAGPYAGAFADAIKASPADSGDARFKAAVVFAPWGGAIGGAPTGLFDQASLAKVKIPTLWIAGTQDDVAGYKGIVALFESAISSRRYLLSFENALHNVAPNPAPPEAKTWAQASRWADPVWDSRRMNNVNEHFVTAFLDFYVKGDAAAGAYLEVKTEEASAGVYAANKDGTRAPNDSYWPGFPARTAFGLSLRSIKP